MWRKNTLGLHFFMSFFCVIPWWDRMIFIMVSKETGIQWFHSIELNLFELQLGNPILFDSSSYHSVPFSFYRIKGKLRDELHITIVLWFTICMFHRCPFYQMCIFWFPRKTIMEKKLIQTQCIIFLQTQCIKKLTNI